MRWLINKKSITFIAVVMVLVVILIGTITMTGNTSNLAATTQTSYVENILNKNKITEVDIDIDEADWDWLIANASKKEPRSCNITINGETFYNVGINPKGNSSLTSISSDDTTDRFSFKLDFGAFVEGQTCFGLEKITLNNVMSDTSYMKEALSYDLFEFMGVATPAYSYSNIKLNGKEWGLYAAVEIIDKSFVQRQFGTTEGNLYKPESMDMLGDNAGGMDMGAIMGSGKGADLKYTGNSASNYSTIKEGAIFNTTSDNDFKKVINMIEHLDSGSNLEKYLDVDEVLGYFAVNTFLVNLDSYAGGMYHNYYLYEKDGVFKIIPWDLNMSFAGMNISDGTKAINFPVDMPVTGKLEDAPLIGKLLEVPKYKGIYHNYLNQISEKYITSGVYEDSIIKTDKLINSYVKKDATALYTYEEYGKAIPMMVIFGLDRVKSIDAQLKGTQPSTTYGTISSTLNLSTLGGMEIGGENMQGEAGNAAMPDMKNIQPIMKIIQEADGKELTAKQKEDLKTLGVDDAMVKTMKSMGNGGGLPSMGNTRTSNIMQIGMIALSIVLLFLGLLFVFKFKRKRFRAK
ncbi:MAG: spore coat protein CotH [Clostridium sp.]